MLLHRILKSPSFLAARPLQTILPPRGSLGQQTSFTGSLLGLWESLGRAMTEKLLLLGVSRLFPTKCLLGFFRFFQKCMDSILHDSTDTRPPRLDCLEVLWLDPLVGPHGMSGLAYTACNYLVTFLAPRFCIFCSGVRAAYALQYVV